MHPRGGKKLELDTHEVSGSSWTEPCDSVQTEEAPICSAIVLDDVN